MDIATNGLASNPFDPRQLDIEVRFTSPQGTHVSIPAFWYQDFDPQTLEPKGQPGWRVRFTPDLPGEWTARAEIAAFDLASQPIHFQVVASTVHGFVRVDQRNSHYFAFDDGSPYFPIGLNLAWAASLENTLADYNRWFSELSRNGGNFARIWMASWSFGIEWNDTGLGDYTKRLKQAWLLDQVVRMASQHGIYLMLTLINHGAFSQNIDPEWSDNPYNASLGGPLFEPEDFVTDPQARGFFQRRLRYIAARYGYSPNLMAWEWWNEVDQSNIPTSRLQPWLAEMDRYLKTVDPYRHLTTLSYSSDAANPGSLPGVSFVQQHDYSGSDPIDRFESAFSRLSKTAPGKPALLAELGASANEEDKFMGPGPIQLHNGLWAAPFTGFTGTAMYWWWDSYIDSLGLWSQFKGISKFFAGQDLTSLEPGNARVWPAKAQALTLNSSNRALIWVRNDTYNYSDAQRAFSSGKQGLAQKDSHTPGSFYYEPSPLSGLTLTLDGLASGNYTISWFDPERAAWLADTTITVRGSKAVISLPAFSCDLALKLTKR